MNRVQKRENGTRELAVLLGLAALALLVAPSYPMVYGAGAVVRSW